MFLDRIHLGWTDEHAGSATAARLLVDPVGFRDLVVTEHALLNGAHPDRYKGFIVAGEASHTALQTPLFYSEDANGVLLNEWTDDFLVPRPFWVDIVEDPVP